MYHENKKQEVSFEKEYNVKGILLFQGSNHILCLWIWFYFNIKYDEKCYEFILWYKLKIIKRLWKSGWKLILLIFYEIESL